MWSSPNLNNDDRSIKVFNSIIFISSSQEQQALLNKVILQHFCRQGLLDISDVLIREANFPIEEDPRLSKAAFQQLNEIQEAFQRRDIGPALDWAIKHR